MLAAFAIALVAVSSFFASATTAYAQENENRWETNETLRGEDSGEQREQNIARINDALRDVNNNGYDGASRESRDVIWGMSFAGSDPAATQRLIEDGLDVNAAQDLISNEEAMNSIGAQNSGSRRFLENNVRTAISSSEDADLTDPAGDAGEGGGGSTGGGSSGELSLEDPHSYSDILASVIMSRSSNGANMDSTSLPMSTLNKYPSEKNSGGSYGRLNSPSGDDGATPAGSAAASYVEALFKFQWIIGGDYNDINGHGQLDGVESKFVGVSNVGASIYDTISNAIEWLSDATSNLNIANLLGLTSSSRDGDNWLSGWVESILSSAGLSSSFAAIQYVAIAIVGGLFLFFLMRAVNSDKNRVRNDGSVKSTGARIAVMILAIPFVTIITATLDGLTHDLSSEQFSGATDVNSQYVVDTLHWAAATNLATGVQPTAGKAAEDYSDVIKPESIGEVNTSARNKLAAAGILSEDDKESASSMLEALREGKVANVNDYFGMIQNVRDKNATNDLAASRTPMAYENTGIKSDAADQQLNMIQPYFLSTRKNLDGVESDDSSSADSSDDATSGDSGDDSSSGGVGSDDGENGTIRIGNSVVGGAAHFKCGDASQMTCDSVDWTKPATYIFGASSGSNNSEEQSDLNNFVAGAGSHQNYDPETREPAEGEVDGVDKARIMESNNYSIAVMNRYAGTYSPGALSTQSTAFILQSEMNDGTLNYHGYNTTQTPEGSTKNTGVNGKVFQRYVVPNSGTGDLASKVASISVMWLCAGIISIVAFFALFRAPILGAIFNMFKGFFQALIAGNVAGLLRYALYYTALRLSFVFASTAITAALLITDMLNGMLGGKTALGSATETGQNISDAGGPSEIDIPGPVNIPNPLSGFMDSVGTAVVVIAAAIIALILTFIVCWPFLSVGAASKSGRPQKFSVVSLLISLPYIMAENACEAVDRMAQKLGHSPSQFGMGGKPLDVKGRGKSSEAVGKAASTAKGAVSSKPSDLVGAAKGAAKGGATGGLTGAAMGAASSKLAGLAGDLPGTKHGLDEETNADARSRVPGDVDGQGVGPDGLPLDETRELPTTQPGLGHAGEDARVDADVDGGESRTDSLDADESKTESSATEHAETGKSETERLDSKSTTSDEIQGDSIKIDKADIGESSTGTAAAAGLGAGALLGSGEGLPNKNETGNVDLHADSVNVVGDVDGGDAQVDTNSATTRSDGAVTMPDAQVDVPGEIDAQGPVNAGGAADANIGDSERKNVEHRSTAHAAEGDSMRAPGGADGEFDAKGLVAGAIASATAANAASNERVIDALEKNRSETRNLGSSVDRGAQATNDVRSSIRGDVSSQLGQIGSSISEQTSRLSGESNAERTRDMRQDALTRESMRSARNESENIAEEVRNSKRN